MGFIRDMETEKTGEEIHCDRGEGSDALVLEREAAANIWTISTR